MSESILESYGQAMKKQSQLPGFSQSPDGVWMTVPHSKKPLAGRDQEGAPGWISAFLPKSRI
jgi:hypothetical protein